MHRFFIRKSVKGTGHAYLRGGEERRDVGDEEEDVGIDGEEEERMRMECAT
jgi:hypothetical protein